MAEQMSFAEVQELIDRGSREDLREAFRIMFGADEPEQVEMDPETQKPRFEITDNGRAEWAASRIVLAHDMLDRAEERRRTYLERLDQDVERARKLVEQAVTFFGGHLEGWVKQQIAGGKKKSVEFLAGLVAGFRKHKARAEVYDRKPAAEYLVVKHPECVKLEPKIDQAALNDCAAANPDEQIPGVQRLAERDVFYLTVMGGQA
jgi:uncharacterized membrane protein